MICSKCGNNIPDNSIFCPACGGNPNSQPAAPTAQPVVQPVAPQPAVQPVAPQPVVQPAAPQPMAQPAMQPMGQPMMQPMGQPKKKSKAPWIILGVSIALLIAIITTVIILLVSCGEDECHDSPQTLVTAAFTALNENDSEALVETLYPALVSRYTTLGYKEEDVATLVRSELLEDMPATVRFTNIKLTESVPSSPEELLEANASLASFEDYEKITAMYVVRGTVTAYSGTESREYTFTADICLCDDVYYLAEISIYEVY